MKNTSTASFLAYSACLAGSLLLGTSVQAQTEAYWRFEGTPGTDIQHVGGSSGVWSADVTDYSGNNRSLSTWATGGGAGEGYRSSVAGPTIPRTGAANTTSAKNTGGGPGMWTDSASLRAWSPTAWTIEASFKSENGGYRTIVGRDSRGAATVNADLGALYLQLLPGNAIGIKFADVGGAWHEAVSAPGAVTTFNFGSDPDGNLAPWYNVAAVSDGSMLSLYLNSGAGYQMVASADLLASGSSNTALSPGAGDGGDWDAGNFTVMRGLYGGNHTDRLYGYIDEVRLSTGALDPSEFLFSVPEPSSFSMILVGSILFAFRRYRACK